MSLGSKDDHIHAKVDFDVESGKAAGKRTCGLNGYMPVTLKPAIILLSTMHVRKVVKKRNV